MGVEEGDILAEVANMLRAVLGEAADEDITMDTTFRHDLEMESIDIVALAGRLQARYGDAVNLAQFVAALDLESVRDLRVGQLVAFIAGALPEADPDKVPA
ncbi:acyl carrier protein [Phytohabitans sp. ZYX-F-186]|uniref:Acyl carrier protein n=1 Tax=Phytohabitans maris TaxID=3071409 RepID=A0ABU0ZTS8_9ACTN|nr:acyl carrier protein [Phytohabitans sp. ZYX-F-186]MDQ7910392.1 acyl carrier protein [Phytohabitans sp. ZYX-F-186]